MLQNITKLLKWVVDLYMYIDLKIFVGTAIMQKKLWWNKYSVITISRKQIKTPFQITLKRIVRLVMKLVHFNSLYKFMSVLFKLSLQRLQCSVVVSIFCILDTGNFCFLSFPRLVWIVLYQICWSFSRNYFWFWASLVVLLVKNPPAKAGNIRDVDCIPD